MIVVAYDIANDKTRTKISKILEDFGDRIQYSVFEIDISLNELEKILKRIKSLLNVDKDSLKIYFICKNCVKSIRTIGVNKSYIPESAVVL